MTTANPGFPMGGLFPSSKKHTLDQLPAYCVPSNCLLQAPISSSQALKHIVDEDISFPFVIKPNAGINGKKVIICETEHDFDTKIVADRYFDAVKHGSRIVQKYADYTQEYGIMYVRLPGEKNGKITGIVQREFHTVVGDGIHTLEELVHDHPRARYRYSSLACYHKKRWHKVIPSGESIMLMDIGNHVRGVTFRDVSNLITGDLEKEIDFISQQIDGFYCGRYDIKADSIQGIVDRHYAVLELNATYGEPTRMYDPSYNWLQTQAILLQHRSYIGSISCANRAAGMRYATIDQYKKAKQQFDSPKI